jgi:FkbM family methyltransferase
MEITSSASTFAKQIIGEKKKKQLQYLGLRVRQALGVPPFTGWSGLDRKLLEHLDEKTAGFFIEAGGNDGFSQSNTYYLEAKLGWRGILIEPVHELASLARRFRGCEICECALGSPDMIGQKITLSFSDLRSSVESNEPVRWNGIFGPNPRTASAEIRTLSDVIAQYGDPDVDLLCLDVEGFEMSVLRGLDLTRHVPEWLLIETERFSEVDAYLSAKYALRDQLSHHDYLFRRR